MFAEVHPSDQAMGSFAASVWHNFRTRRTVTAQGTAVRGDKPPRMCVCGGGGGALYKSGAENNECGKGGIHTTLRMCVRVCASTLCAHVHAGMSDAF